MQLVFKEYRTIIFSKTVLQFLLGGLFAYSATFGQAFIFPNAIAGALQNTAHSAGKASAMFSSLQMIIISAFSAIMAILPDNNALSLASIIIVLGLLSGITFRRLIVSPFN